MVLDYRTYEQYENAGVDDGDYILLATRYPVAKKEYSCLQCGDPIAKGEKHKVTVYKYDGHLYQDREHIHACFLAKECEQIDRMEYRL